MLRRRRHVYPIHMGLVHPIKAVPQLSTTSHPVPISGVVPSSSERKEPLDYSLYITSKESRSISCVDVEAGDWIVQKSGRALGPMFENCALFPKYSHLICGEETDYSVCLDGCVSVISLGMAMEDQYCFFYKCWKITYSHTCGHPT